MLNLNYRFLDYGKKKIYLMKKYPPVKGESSWVGQLG